mmetsp:Transcript_2164/g.4985  ORF Transcript_2164/g.4985 Transcript_2164/m.4985 type:complete len:518 (+) Transcript_2164:29-1582(+)
MDPSDVGELIESACSKIRKYVQQKRVRLDPFFEAYDRLRHRTITRTQFVRALNAAVKNQVYISPEEEEALFSSFSRPDNMINYRDFCDFCMQVKRDLEKQPWVELAEEQAPSRIRHNELSDKDEIYFHKSLLPKLQHISREQGLVVKNHFLDFDFNRNGRVTKGQFLRGLPDKFQVACSNQDVDLLVQKYGVQDMFGVAVDVDYHSLHLDVSGSDPALSLPDGLTLRAIEQAESNVDAVPRIPVLSQLERRVRQICRDKKLLLLPFFQDFDKRRTGYCTSKIFTRVLASLGLDTIAEELDILASIYQSDKHKDQWVDYKAFCEEMTSSPSAVRSQLQELFDALRREFCARGAAGLVGLLNSFESKDVSRKGLISLANFSDSLRACGVSLSSDELDALFAHFGQQGMLNYLAFVREVRGSLRRNRRVVVEEVFSFCFLNTGLIDMQRLFDEFDASFHPRCMDGSLTYQDAQLDLEDGVSLRRAGYAPTKEDLLDYWAMISFNITDEQFEFCVRRSRRL